MIQELLGSPALIGRERKLSMNINGGGLIFEGTPHSLSSPSLSPSPSPSPSTPNISPPVAAAAVAAPTATTTTTTSTTNSSNPENLRCPRCDSSNTKFCYYNNYNLTQPRHFCKTCRRYWTKGGALRNVPIGGGCRKNKNSTVSSSVAKSSAAKFKNLSTEIGRSGLIGGFNHELPANPVLWASPQGSHILALLRASQSPNPNPSSQNPHLVTLKEEKNLIGTHLMPEPGIANSAMSARNLGIMDPLVHLPSWTSLLRNNPQQQVPHQICHQQQSGIILGGNQVQNSGMQSLYLRLRASSTGNYNTYSEQSPEILGNVAASSSSPSSTSILESVPAPMSELGYWNPAFCLSDLPTTNSAYP